MTTRAQWLAMLLVIASCAGGPTRGGLDISPEILSEVNRIRAIDNHAHPVRFVSEGIPDREFDAPPKSLDEYLRLVVTPILEQHKQGGALAEKFEAAYLRPLSFEKADRAAAEKIYANYVGRSAPPDDEYKTLQDFLFRFIASEC